MAKNSSKILYGIARLKISQRLLRNFLITSQDLFLDIYHYVYQNEYLFQKILELHISTYKNALF